MHTKKNPIPVNTMADDSGSGISIEKIALKDLHATNQANANDAEEAHQSHRHDRHSFFLLESGKVTMEIDFQKYIIKSPSVIFIHPDQVHRIIALENVRLSTWAITHENLNPGYLELLEEIRPAKPLVLEKEIFSLIDEMAAICIKFAERENDKLYHALLRDGCNALVALVASQYMSLTKSANKLSRFDVVTKAFRKIVERNYASDKRPAAYALKLNVSTSYLNECVKNTTGHSVSYHIQQRVILEAKRLLYHSDQSVKEIAAALGYDDYAYFSRLFTKVTGMTAIAFRNKNLD